MKKMWTIVDARSLCRYDLEGGEDFNWIGPSSRANCGCGDPADIEDLTDSGKRCWSIVVSSGVRSDGSASRRYIIALTYNDRARRPSA